MRLKETVDLLARFHILAILDVHQDVYNANFWTSDVVGHLEGQFDFVSGKVARYFSTDPWVIGFDPFNKPFSSSLVRYGGEHFDAQLQCFYTGKAHTGPLLRGAAPLRCPRAVPDNGVVLTLLFNDFDALVFNFHVYCSAAAPHGS